MNRDFVTLKVKDVCGPHCVGVEDGLSLFERMLPLFGSGKRVLLDFRDVLTITSSFLNASIGKLFGRFEADDLKNRFKWKGLDENDDQLLELVIKNAKEHFAKSPKMRKAEDNIVRQTIEEE